MELKQLKYFLCVAEVGSFSRAAVMLSVAQPILSRQIKALEQDLSAELFYRNGRGIVLSEAGKLLEGYAKEIIGIVDRASFEITAMKSAPSGRITIAMPPSIGWVLTVPLVQRCRREFPMIALHVVEGFSGHVTEWLSTGRIDIGPNESVTIEVINVTGHSVTRGAIRQSDFRIDLPSNLPAGLYYAQMTSAAGSTLTPFVVK